MTTPAIVHALRGKIAIIGDRTLDVTSPVYADTGKARPEPIGSAVFLRVNQTSFVVTAAHVQDTSQRADLYVGGSKLLALEGRYLVSSTPATGGRDEDQIDLAIMPLSAQQLEALGPTAFVDIKATCPAHRNNPIPVTGTYYLVSGFPVSKQPTRLPTDTLDGQPVYLAAKALPEEAIVARGLDPRHHILLEYDKEAVWGPGGSKVGPDLTGMSGGGIWAIEGLLTPTLGPECLVAIGTEWDRSAKTVLGTRIGLVIDAIGDNYPDLRPFLPTP
jgi:hypothetical protein